MADASKIDELLEKAKRLQAQAGKPANDTSFKGAIKGSVIGDTLNNVKALNATAEEVKGGATFFKELGLSIYGFVKRSWPGRAYAWLFRKVAYKKDKKTGEKHFSKKRAGAMILTTAFMATAIIPGMIGSPARSVMGAVAEPVYDGARMTTMMHKDIYYLNDQHLANHEENTWVVKGTRERGAGVDEAILFTVKPSLAHDVWNWAHKGHPFFIPDQVVAPVAPSNNQAYLVTSYGVRWRLAKWLQAYPVMLDAQPVTTAQADAFNAAVRAGQNPSEIPVPAATTTAPQVQTQAPAPVAPVPGR